MQDPSDIVKGHFTQIRISAFFIEKRGIAIKDGLVNVHTATIVTEKWLRHESCCFAKLLRCIVNDVFIYHQIISSFKKRVETEVNFSLTCSCYFVVMTLNTKSCFFKQTAHFTTDILLLICWCYRNISTFNRYFETKVATVFSTAGVPASFFGIHFIVRAIHAALMTYIVEDKELGFRCEECCCTYTALLQIFLSTDSNTAGITFITVTVWCKDITKNVQGRMCCKRINKA
ncbi:hypothetical protein D3C81_1043070 [compost metagenome]